MISCRKLTLWLLVWLNLVVTLHKTPKMFLFCAENWLEFLVQSEGSRFDPQESWGNADTMTPTLETCRLKKREGIRIDRIGAVYLLTSLTMIPIQIILSSHLQFVSGNNGLQDLRMNSTGIHSIQHERRSGVRHRNSHKPLAMNVVSVPRLWGLANLCHGIDDAHPKLWRT